MPYSEPEFKVLREYGIIDDKGKLAEVYLERPEEKPLGKGPILEQTAINHLLAADTSKDKRWLAWIFYQAAGGEKGKEASKRALEQIKKRFIEERVNGFQHPVSKEYYGPVPRANAEARWEEAKSKFKEIVDIADQDSVEKLGVFGFFRHWPGQSQIYAKAERAITNFLKLYPKLLQMNKELRRKSRDEQPTEPSQIGSIEQMEQITKKVDRYFASKKAREDIRTDTIYQDDYIDAVAPLTYAAAVRFGWQTWAWADPAKFDEVLSGEGHSYSDQWLSNTKQGKVYVYLMFKVPVPSWVGRSKSAEFKRYTLLNLALEMDREKLKRINPDDIVVWDEENRNTLRIGDVKQMILNEPTRERDPQDDEIPLKHGLQPATPETLKLGTGQYRTKEGAEQIVWHLNKAVEAVIKWARTFNPKRIKSNAMTLSDEE